MIARSLLLCLLLTSACARSKRAVQSSGARPEAAPPKPEPVPARPLAKPAPLHTVLHPVANKPIVAFRLVFHSGAVDDPKGKEGLTALTAALMSQGGTQELSSSQLLEALFPMAAELDANTSKEFTVFSGRVHRDNLERFFKIFGDVLLEPRYDPKELERLRTNALSAIRNELRGENDEKLGKVALDSMLFEGHPYAHFTGGTVQGLQAITLEDIKAHAQSVFTKVKDRLSKLPATGAAPVALPPAPGFKGRTLVLKKDSLSTAISFGYPYALRRGDPDYFPIAFALSYLGEHRQVHGQLFQELREKRGLNYGDYAYAEHFAQEGYGSMPSLNVGRSLQDFSIWIRPVEPQNALFATRGALYFLDQLAAKPISPERFETAKGFLVGYTRLLDQTDQRRLGYLIDEAFYGTPRFLESYRAALQTLTPEQVQAAARRHLSVGQLNFIFVAKDAEGLAKALRAKAPSPIQYPTPKPAEVTELDQSLAKFPLPMHPALLEVREVGTFMEK